MTHIPGLFFFNYLVDTMYGLLPKRIGFLWEVCQHLIWQRGDSKGILWLGFLSTPTRVAFAVSSVTVLSAGSLVFG